MAGEVSGNVPGFNGVRAIGLLIWLLLSWPAAILQAQEVDLRQVRSDFIQPLQPVGGLDVRKVRLGERLFHEPQLSGDGSISCASCHAPDRAGIDGLSRSVGAGGRTGGFNAPTVFNAVYNSHQFWDARALTLEDQITGPIGNPVEMNSSWPKVLTRLKLDGAYRRAFTAIYGDGVTADNVRDAIAIFERTLVTLDAPFDRYLRGEEGAISEKAKRGYELFKSYGCIACHQGRNVGGNMLQKFGVIGDYFADHGKLDDADNGRFNVTGDERDRYVFKVPSLRLAVLTAPYFHDGSVSTLEKAIRIMARYQLGREIPDEDVALIIDFLHTLPGRFRGESLHE